MSRGAWSVRGSKFGCAIARLSDSQCRPCETDRASAGSHRCGCLDRARGGESRQATDCAGEPGGRFRSWPRASALGSRSRWRCAGLADHWIVPQIAQQHHRSGFKGTGSPCEPWPAVPRLRGMSRNGRSADRVIRNGVARRRRGSGSKRVAYASSGDCIQTGSGRLRGDISRMGRLRR